MVCNLKDLTRCNWGIEDSDVKKPPCKHPITQEDCPKYEKKEEEAEVGKYSSKE